jgi:hypothetical protein
VLDILEAQGAALGRPYVDTIKGSDFTNMKELRVQHDGDREHPLSDETQLLHSGNHTSWVV